MASKSESALLGLVAGLGVGAGIFYYRSLVNAHLGLGRTVPLTMDKSPAELGGMTTTLTEQ